MAEQDNGSAENESANIPGRKDASSKYLTFSLGEEEFGINILKIKEIIGLLSITPVPRTPPFVKGVINLRGKVIPVVDLRLRFELSPVPYTDRTCIVVVEIRPGATLLEMGIIVDSVSEVLNIPTADIEAVPGFGSACDMEYIAGMAKIDGRVKILLDIDRLLSPNEISFIENPS